MSHTKHLISARHVLHLQHSAPCPSSPLLVPRSLSHCHDSRPLQRGTSPELPPVTGYEPNRIVEDCEKNMHFTEDQITELEDRVKPFSYNQSTYDSAESIATPPESDFDDEQLRALLASPLYLQERGANAERSQVCHSERENLMSSSSQDPTTGGTGKPVAVISSQSKLNQETFSDQFSLKHQQVFGSNKPMLGFSNPANVVKSLLDGNRTRVSMSFSRKLMMHSDWNCRTPITDVTNPEESKSDCKKS